MKKIFYLFLTLSVLTFSSCDSDDDATPEKEETDPIVGVWYFYSDNGELVDDCAAKSTITFGENGAYIVEEYVTNMYNADPGEECSPEPIFNDAYWSNIGNAIYRITITEEEEEITDINVSFSDNNQTMTITYFSGGDDDEVLIYKK